MKALLALFLALSACASAAPTGITGKIPIRFKYREKGPTHGSNDTRIKTTLNLEPGEKTLLAGVVVREGKKPSNMEHYYILAEPIDNVVHFTITKNDKTIGQMKLLMEEGDRGVIDGTDSQTEIEIIRFRKGR